MLEAKYGLFEGLRGLQIGDIERRTYFDSTTFWGHFAKPSVIWKLKLIIKLFQVYASPLNCVSLCISFYDFQLFLNLAFKLSLKFCWFFGIMVHFRNCTMSASFYSIIIIIKLTFFTVSHIQIISCKIYIVIESNV